jgi:hypothetical protein
MGILIIVGCTILVIITIVLGGVLTYNPIRQNKFMKSYRKKYKRKIFLPNE